MLDADKGGGFALAPEAPFTAERRYLPDTNVLETTFATDGGTARVTDAMLLPTVGLVRSASSPDAWRGFPGACHALARRAPVRVRAPVPPHRATR